MKLRFKPRHQYDLESEEAAAHASGILNTEPSLTNQQFKDDVNINVMVKRFGIGDGSLPPAAMDPSYFGDFGEGVDLRDAFDQVRAASERFGELPAEIRTRFNQDPAALLAFVHDPANAAEAVKLGLLAEDRAPVEPAPKGDTP